MLEVTQDGGAFAFTDENRKKVTERIKAYPEGRQRSVVLYALDLAQRQNAGWLSRAALEHVAEVLELPLIWVLEAATFYSMFNLKPVGRYHLQVCGTTPCWLAGSDDVFRACKEMGIEKAKTTEDGLFTLTEVECLGACCNAPMMQVNDDYYEDLDHARTKAVLEAFKRGETPAPGPQVDRQCSAPVGGPTVLGDHVPEAVTPGGALKE